MTKPQLFLWYLNFFINYWKFHATFTIFDDVYIINGNKKMISWFSHFSWISNILVMLWHGQCWICLFDIFGNLVVFPTPGLSQIFIFFWTLFFSGTCDFSKILGLSQNCPPRSSECVDGASWPAMSARTTCERSLSSVSYSWERVYLAVLLR